MKVGLYPMCADILHAGHILAIKEAKQHCDYLVVALNCKPDNKATIQSVYERMTQLQGVKYIDEIICYEGRRDMELLCKSFDYDIRFLGEDYIGKEWDGKNIELEMGKKIHFLHRKHKLSSKELKERLNNQRG